MPGLLDNIAADAEARLPHAADRAPRDELARYKKFLKDWSLKLRFEHRGGAGGRDICQARSAVLDALLRHLGDALHAHHVHRTGKRPPAMAMVALGGYGRGELNPLSDLDVMFLHHHDAILHADAHPWTAVLISEGLLFDLGLKPGFAVRSVADCVTEARKDMQTKTSLIEARLISGDGTLFDRFQRTLIAQVVVGQEDAYIAARVKDQAERHAKHGNSPTMQEPNIKNGCGGLRDYQNLCWMAFFKHRTITTEQMLQQGFIQPAVRRQLDAAYDFLLRARNELHYLSTRATDALTKAVIPKIAWQLGYTDRSPRVRLERFLTDYYTHSRNIYLITRTLEERLALLPKSTPRASKSTGRPRPGGAEEEQIVDGFKITGDRISAASPRVFDESPRKLMRVFLHMQQRGVSLHPDLAQLIREKLRLVKKDFLADEHVRQTFLEILDQRGNISRVLRAMHETGLLGRYLPEFGRITSQVQHEFFHQYTVDEHTLVCLAKLDALWAATEPWQARYAEIMQALERPFLLHLALLLHDCAKPDSHGNHAAAGAVLAAGVARRLQLDEETTRALCLLIEHHLEMIRVSQRRDLDDAAVIHAFAQLVQSAENLRMLTLLTVADSLGTSDKLWNGFKDGLLQSLHFKALAILTGGTEFLVNEARRREHIEAETRDLVPRTFSDDEVSAHFAHLPPRYFTIHTPREIAADLALAHRFMHHQLSEEERALEPVVHWRNEPDRGCTELKICTWDRAGLFSKICGSFSAAGINILSAQVFTRIGDGIALDTFHVTDAAEGGTVAREARERCEEILTRSLTGGDVDFPAHIARRRREARPLWHVHEGEQIATRVTFDNHASQEHTVIEVEAEDRIGLLYALSQALAGLGLNIALAKILTEQGAAQDSFYVHGQMGGKIESPDYQKHISQSLCKAIATLDAAH